MICLFLVICYSFTVLWGSQDIEQANFSRNAKATLLEQNQKIHYVFGFSTGHTGSTSLHKALVQNDCCPWNINGAFETQGPDERAHEKEDDTCNYTRTILIPFLDRERGSKTWVDMGHYHNRGPVLECLASLLGNHLAFVQIRRNRHDIAASFSKLRGSPCQNAKGNVKGKNKPPFVSYCPVEDDGTPVALPVRRHTWNQFTTFQKYLWEADELEYRFHKLKMEFPNGPRYLEVTWSSGDELTAGVQDIQKQLGCQELPSSIPHAKAHVNHTAGTVNCSKRILQDLAYRKLVGYYNQEQRAVLFEHHPQHVDSVDCMDTREEMIRAIQSSPEESLDNWVLPDQ